MSMDKTESNICAPALLNLLKMLRNEIKCSASLVFYPFSSSRLINLIKHEHSCEFLYIMRCAMVQSCFFYKKSYPFITYSYVHGRIQHFLPFFFLVFIAIGVKLAQANLLQCTMTARMQSAWN